MSLLQRVRRALEPTFAVERELGAGGMGIVFEARDTRLERQVAVKVLRPESATAVAAHRFLREARMLARLKHPNVVQVHQAGESDGLYWFVMDLVRGETLASRISRGALSEKDTLSLARELLSALAVAHEHGIVHRDIKPSNIFLENGHALLADFGIARTTTTSGSEGGVTATRELIGTPAYMSPEQMSGDEAGPAADQYSLALVLYECVSGKRWPPLQRMEAGDLRSVPGSIAGGLKRALAPSPGERWPDIRAFGAALGSRQRPWARLAAAAAGLAVIGWGIALALGEPRAEDRYSAGRAAPVRGQGERTWKHAGELYRSGAFVAADSAYRAVLARDSSCLHCEFRLLELDRWLERRSDSTRIVRVLSGQPLFPEPWSRLVGAALAPFDERIDRLEELTRDYRDWPLTWYYLGSELFNRGALFGRSRGEALDALEQLARLDSSFVPSWTDRALAHIAAGDSAAASASLARLLALPRAEGLAQAQRLLAGLAFAFRFTSQGLELWSRDQSDPALLAGIPELAAGPRVLPGVGTPEGGVLLGRAFESTREKTLQRSGLIAQMLGNVALGRLDSARRAGQRLNAIFPDQQLFAFAVMLDAAVVLLDDETSASEAAQVEATLTPLMRAIMLPPVRRDAAWLAALAAIRRRDPAAAQARLANVADEAAPGYRSRFITAALLAVAGRPDSALVVTNLAVTDLEVWDRVERSPLLRVAIRLSRARWYAAMGGSESARAEYRWHQHFHLPDYPADDPVSADGDWAFSTLASWRQARLLDKGPSQDPVDVEVCESYRLVAERWSGGDARYRARADTAEARLAALKCGQSA